MVNKTNKTGNIGTGYVGLPLVLDFCEAGLRVIGFNIDEHKVELLQEGESYISYSPSTMC